MKAKVISRISQIGSWLRKLGALRLEVSHSSLLHGSSIFLILLIAFLVRLLPIRWIPSPWIPDHYYLSEFDPYFQYRITEHIVENGFLSWLNWHDDMGWYPWGRDMATASFPGLALTAASFYMIVRALGAPIDLVQFSLAFPAVMGAVTCFVMYFVGKDIGGESVGLFSAFFLALNSSYIGRTSLGFFDDETVGIFGILLFILFFLRAIEKERPLKDGIMCAVAAGLSLGYLSASWGATRYPMDVTVLFVFVLLLAARYSSRLFLDYGVCFGVALLIAGNVPKLGIGFLREVSVLPVYGIFLILCAFEIYHRMKTQKMKVLGVAGFLAIILVIFASLWILGYFETLAGRYVSVLNPLERAASPLIESVAEHRASAWGTFYFDFGVLALFIPIGLFFAVQMATDRSIFVSIFVLTSLYFAGSMVRLTLIMSPAVCLVCALGVVRLMKPFVTLLNESAATSKRKVLFRTRLGKEFSVGFLIVIFLLFTLTYVVGTDSRSQRPRVFDQAYSPVTIASASMGFRPGDIITDWLDALIWMRENLPPSPPWQPPPGSNLKPTIVASWWDYGYWITTIANRTSLADNGTLNTTQIAQIAQMFMSRENESIEILKKYDVTHVVVFTTADSTGQDHSWGEAGKFTWMIKIAGLNESDFGSYSQQGAWQWSSYGQNTTLYKMMTYGKYVNLVEERQQNAQLALQQYYELLAQWEYFNKCFTLVYSSKGQGVYLGTSNNEPVYLYAIILVYEVVY